MTYRPPPVDVALPMIAEIESFLVETGGPYKDGIKEYVNEHIILAVATGQFFYKKGLYFVCWWFCDEAGLVDVVDHKRPSNVRIGPIMYIPECACRDMNGMREIRRKLRRAGAGKKGVHWHRSGKGWQHFPRQEGGVNGRQ